MTVVVVRNATGGGERKHAVRSRHVCHAPCAGVETVRGRHMHGELCAGTVAVCGGRRVCAGLSARWTTRHEGTYKKKSHAQCQNKTNE